MKNYAFSYLVMVRFKSVVAYPQLAMLKILFQAFVAFFMHPMIDDYKKLVVTIQLLSVWDQDCNTIFYQKGLQQGMAIVGTLVFFFCLKRRCYIAYL